MLKIKYKKYRITSYSSGISFTVICKAIMYNMAYTLDSQHQNEKTKKIKQYKMRDKLYQLFKTLSKYKNCVKLCCNKSIIYMYKCWYLAKLQY